MNLNKNIYRNRFTKKELTKKTLIWKVLCKDYFSKYIDPNDTVVDVGAGFCEFINNIKAEKKIAIDVSPDVKRFASKNVKVIQKDFIHTSQKKVGKADVVFISNFLEHLDSKREVVDTFENSIKILRKNGKIIILQPNIDLAKEKYWDYIDHKLALNTKSVIEALEITGFKNIRVTERFLPLTVKSHFPINQLLISVYLRLPSFIRPFAGQSLFVATKE